MLPARSKAEGRTMSENDLDARVELLEEALATAFEVQRRDRYEIQVLKAALATLIDSLRPDDSDRAAEWFEAMLEVSTTNVGLHAELATDEIIRDFGVDTERLGAVEDEKTAVEQWLTNYFTGIKETMKALGVACCGGERSRRQN